MLRITIDEKPDTVVLRLEGSLIGPWIKDVEECWRSVFEEFGTRSVQIDLSAVSFMDTEGGALLTRMYNAGFRLKGGSSANWLPMADGTKPSPDAN
ncbi:MAG TPA: STAS domain-containing protein [Terriglobia bacterium]|jgi:anti-anti-sigma regulatory factor|nr:STAS domain-containing protein [Terriglobia bacterium]